MRLTPTPSPTAALAAALLLACALLSGLDARAQCTTATPLPPGTSVTANTIDGDYYLVEADAAGQFGFSIIAFNPAGAPTSYTMSLQFGCPGAPSALHTYLSNSIPAGGSEVRFFRFGNAAPAQPVYVYVRRSSPGVDPLNYSIERSPAPALANDVCGGATPLALTSAPSSFGARSNGATAVTLFGATDSGQGSTCANAAQNNDRFYAVTVPASGSVAVGLQDAPNNFSIVDFPSGAVLTLYDACGGTQLDCSSVEGPAFVRRSVFAVNRTPGETLYVGVSMGRAPAAPLVNWIVPVELYAYDPGLAPPANDDCAAAAPLTCGATQSGLLNAAVSAGSPGATTCSVSRGVWYSLAGTGEVVTVEVTPTPLNAPGTPNNLSVHVASGSCGALAFIDCADEAANCSNCPGTETLSFATAAGTDYYVFVGQQGITAQPVNETFDIATACTSCPAPTAITVDVTSATEAVIAYQSLATGLPHTFEYGPQGFTLGTGTTVAVPGNFAGFTASGLAPLTSYDVYVSADCGSAVTGPETFTTLSTCLPPDNLGTQNTNTSTGFDLFFDAAAGAQSYEIEVGISGFTPGTGAAAFAATAPGSPVSVSGLAPLTSYDAYVRSDCGGGSLSDWGPGLLTFTLPAGPANDLCADATALSCGANLLNETTVGAFATGAAGLGCPAYGGGVWYEITGDGNFHTLAVTPAAGFDAALAIASGSCGGLTNVACVDAAPSGQAETYTLATQAGTTYYLYVAPYTASGSAGAFTVGSVCAACAPASSATATAVTNEEATITVTGPAGAYTVEYGTAGFALGLGQTASIAAGQTAVTLTGLSGATDYEYYVTADCGSAPLGPNAFTTLADPLTCGDTFYDAGGPNGNYANNTYEITTICPDVAGQQVTLTFTAFDLEQGFDFMSVYDGPGITGTALATALTGTSIPGPYTSTSPDGCLTVLFTADQFVPAAGWAADVTCSGPTGCPAPLQVFALPTGPTSVSLNWNAAAGAVGYEIEVGPQGFTPATNTATATASVGAVTVAGLGGLQPGTAYDAYVSTTCAADVSVWTGPAPFTTSSPPPANDACANAVPLALGSGATCATTTTGTTVDATSTAPSSCNGGAGEVWYSAVVSASGTIAFAFDATAGTMGFGFLEVYAACGGSSIACTAQPDEQGTVALYGQTPGATLYAAVRPYFPGDAGTFEVCATDNVLPVAPAAGCAPTVSVQVDGFGPAYVPVVDASGDILAVIGNDEFLGQVDVTLYGDQAAGLRQGPGGFYFLDRQLAINVAQQPSSPVEVIVFVTAAEINELIALDPTVNSLADIQFAKVSGLATCTGAVPNNAQAVTVTAQPYGSAIALRSFVTSFSEFFVAPVAAPLPVELARFEASAKTDHNAVRWTTAAESDLAHFTLESSGDGTHFAPVEQVLPKGEYGRGAAYEVFDRAPRTLTYYRLASRDLDGTTQHSRVIAVDRGGRSTGAGFALAPNPTRGRVTLDFAGGASAAGAPAQRSIVVADLAGRRVREYRLDADRERLELDLSGVPAGVYSVTVTDARGARTLRLAVE